MQDLIEIQGGKPLIGTIRVGGAKNAALPQFMAALLTAEKCVFTNVPLLQDIDYTINLLEQLGASVDYTEARAEICVPKILTFEASYSLVKALRASFWVLAPLLARFGEARVALPGGDAIGNRPVDLHISGLQKMGADIKLQHGVVYASAPSGLRPADIEFSFPSVGATHQILMAAALTPGVTTIKGAAREPEVVALCQMLSQMGAKISGAGEDLITIEGRKHLTGATVELIGDRIEAGTYLAAAAAAGGELTVEGVNPSDLGAFIDILRDMGASVQTLDNRIRIKKIGRLKAVNVETAPFPGLATDLQAPLMAALTLAEGQSTIEETIFEARFTHVSELKRMGAKIDLLDRCATIYGVEGLSAAPVEGFDIRGAAALVVAGLAAEGVTQISEIHHLRRGYEQLEEKLRGVGSQIGCRPEDFEDALAIGC